MTVESSRMQMPTAAQNPMMNVQFEVKKDLQNGEKLNNTAGNAQKQMVAGLSVSQPQSPQQVATEQISKGYLDIKI